MCSYDLLNALELQLLDIYCFGIVLYMLWLQAFSPYYGPIILIQKLPKFFKEAIISLTLELLQIIIYLILLIWKGEKYFIL